MHVVREAKSKSPSVRADKTIDASTWASVQYQYEGLRIQAGGRGLLGFEKVTSYDPQFKVRTTTTYRQDFPYIGSPWQTEQIYVPANRRLSYAENTWATQALAWGGSLPYIQSSTEDAHDPETGNLLKATTSTFSYDGHGNVLSSSVSVSGGGQTYTKATSNEYGQDDISQWRLGRLTRTTVATKRPEGSSTRVSGFAYHSSNGLLIREVVEPTGDPRSKLTTAYAHDGYGNRSKTTVCSSHIAEDQCGTAAYSNPGNDPLYINRSSQAEYGDGKGRFVTKAVNALGQFETTQYNGSFGALGLPSQKTSLNGQSVTFSYDELGRPETETLLSDGTVSSAKTYFCSGTLPAGIPACPTGVGAVLATVKQGYNGTVTVSPTQVSYSDILGRSLRASVQGFDGSFIHTDSRYDTQGRVRYVSDPHYGETTSLWSTTDYDPWGRAETVTSAAGVVTRSDYQGLDAIATVSATSPVPRSQTKTERRNANGDLISVTDNLGNSVAYSYDGAGNLYQVTPPGGPKATITMHYDGLGRKIRMQDPDKGTWTYEYNALGEILVQTDAKGQKAVNSYDRLGRLVQREDRQDATTLVGTTTWTYHDGTGSNAGKLAGETLVESGKTVYARGYSYDETNGRLQRTDVQIDGAPQMSMATSYDAYGRVDVETDALGGQTRREYVFGYLKGLKDVASCTPLWTVDRMDEYGRVAAETLGNGLKTTRTYDGHGHLDSLSTLTGGNASVQSHDYDFDALGNLTRRKLKNGTNAEQTEDFVYDGLNRLTDVTQGGNTTLHLDYDAAGNIISKTGLGSYTYDPSKLHAVKTAGGQSYAYDANGNMTTGAGRTLDYTSYDLLARVSQGGKSAEFRYGTDRARYQRIDTGADGKQTTTYYLGNVELVAKPDGELIGRRTVGNAVFTRWASTGIEQLNYVLKDHLGSTDVITDKLGAIVQAYSFDAFGKARSAANWGGPADLLMGPSTEALIMRGYTGHEQLDEFGLIHMNGRVYDASLGRFIQADPVVDGVTDTQGYNRYSYVKNNPLSYTDPSGYSSVSRAWKRWGRTVLAIVLSVFTGGASLVWLLASGFVSGYLMTGTLKGAVIGAFTAGVAAAAGAIINAAGITGTLAQAGVRALAGGVSSVLQGGKFGHGFVSAGVASVAGSTVIGKIGNPVGKVLAEAIVGGTVSEMTGGKFRNGAITAAFQAAVRLGYNEYREQKLARADAGSVRNFKYSQEDVPDDGSDIFKQAATELRASARYEAKFAVSVRIGDREVVKTFDTLEQLKDYQAIKGESATMMDGYYDPASGEIVVFKSATLGGSAEVGVKYGKQVSWEKYSFSRVGYAKFVIGHEVGHAEGLDLDLPDQPHYQANRRGLVLCGAGCVKQN